MALRGLYLINPEQQIEHITMNNMGIGRNVDEAKRLLQASQFVAEHGEVTLYHKSHIMDWSALLEPFIMEFWWHSQLCHVHWCACLMCIKQVVERMYACRCALQTGSQAARASR